MSGPNEAQIDYWNGRAGEKWAAMQVALDAMLTPVTAALKERVGAVTGKRVLDIGCGAGETCTIWLDGGAQVTGLDVSAPMLAVAKARTGGRAELIRADASVWRADAPFDLAVSRFGVMFFDAPEAAFASIAANVRPGGRLVFVCWRASAENEWVTVPMDAIRALLPEVPPPAPDAPGPFALADRDRLGGMLARAGFSSVAIEPLDLAVCLAQEGGVDAAVQLVKQLGPAGRALAEAGEEVAAAATAPLAEALAPHDKDGRVTLGGAIWLVEAIREG